LRLAAGLSLIHFGLSSTFGDAVVIARDLVAAAGGMLVLAGLWTPPVGAVVAIDQLWVASSQHLSQYSEPWIHILLAAMCAALAMLGPGAWSVDARLFGRKRFDIGNRTRGQ
jgi:putative oxidoreductase